MPPGAGCISGMWGGWHGWGADIDLHLDSVWKSANSMGHNKRKIKVKEGQKLYNKLYTEMKLLQRGWAKLKAGGKTRTRGCYRGLCRIAREAEANKSWMCKRFAVFRNFVCQLVLRNTLK